MGKKAKGYRIFLSPQQEGLIGYVATNRLKVSITQFLKRAALEMAHATLRFQDERRQAEAERNADGEGEGDPSTAQPFSNDSTGVEELLGEDSEPVQEKEG